VTDAELAWLCDRADARTAPGPATDRVWVLQAVEDDGIIELHGVFRDLERAKHHLEPKYPNLSAWEETTYRHVHGGPEMRAWRAHTGKHPVIIEETTLDDARPARPEPAAGEPLCVCGHPEDDHFADPILGNACGGGNLTHGPACRCFRYRARPNVVSEPPAPRPGGEVKRLRAALRWIANVRETDLWEWCRNNNHPLGSHDAWRAYLSGHARAALATPDAAP
jgi:hypothetical protein